MSEPTLPQPAIVALSGVSVGKFTTSGSLSVTLGAATETDSALSLHVTDAGKT